jgi:hypothetical protein
MTPENMPVTQHNDVEPVPECPEDRRDAFGRVVERSRSLTCPLAYSAAGSLSRSEDLEQDVFVIAWRQFPDLREPAQLRPWLCGIARNLSAESRWLSLPEEYVDVVEQLKAPAAGLSSGLDWHCCWQRARPAIQIAVTDSEDAGDKLLEAVTDAGPVRQPLRRK